MFLKILLLVVFCLPLTVQAALTGIWKGDKEGTFYIQESRGNIYWYAEQLSRNPYWAHIFSGKIKDLEIKGTWVDIPKGKSRNQGRLIAKVTPDGKHIEFKGSGLKNNRLYRWENKPISSDSEVVITRPAIPEEKCMSINPARSKVENVAGRWVISDGGNMLFDFDRKRLEADQALKIIKHYRMDSLCYLSQTNSGISYLLSGNQAPIGKLVDDDCVVFDPGKLRLEEVSGSWKLSDANQWVFDFGQDVKAAKKSLELIRKYHFSRVCYVGRPDPSFQYLRQ